MTMALARRREMKQRLRRAFSAPATQCVRLVTAALCIAAACAAASAQDDHPEQNSAGYVPVVSGGFAYVQNASGGVQTLQPQINPLLLVPFGRSFLLESRVDFTGVFSRQDVTGPYVGKVFKTIESAQIHWLPDSHVTATAGRFLLPFGLYSERLSPVWIHDLQDFPLTYSIGTHPDGSADGLMLRGVAASLPWGSVQYSAYVSAHSSIVQLPAERAAGGDMSVFFPTPRFEAGLSYQRSLEGYQINNEAAYLSWQPQNASTDVKAEYDRNHYGDGYWIEAAHMPQNFFFAPTFFRRVQLVGRMEQLFVRNGGGHGLPTVDQQRPEVGLNYKIRDDWKLVSNYGRLFSKSGDSNMWNFGFTYRFIWPLWPGRKQ